MYRALPVPDAIRAFVDGIWSYRGRGVPHRVLPDGCLDFIVNLGSGRGAVVGPMSRAIVVPVRDGVTSFGVRFRPGHAARFIDAHASELLDTQGALGALTRVGMLAERLAEAPSDAERVSTIQRILLEAGARTRAADALVEHAVTQIARTRGQIAVHALAAGVGLSERQLERRFLERVGLGPKRLARITRFERALGLLERRELSQAEIAARAGYSDEPHLLRDFRALAGITPATLLCERVRDVGFVQGDAAVMG
jgi:AraC-like DNA-binding protein